MLPRSCCGRCGGPRVVCASVGVAKHVSGRLEPRFLALPTATAKTHAKFGAESTPAMLRKPPATRGGRAWHAGRASVRVVPLPIGAERRDAGRSLARAAPYFAIRLIRHPAIPSSYTAAQCGRPEERRWFMDNDASRSRRDRTAAGRRGSFRRGARKESEDECA